ncbi:MAG: YbaK/EbsC family protein [Clostridium sp.]|uniref:YbaK/EbsC family protein n=1 Tax=Clostridium sp. TaxID=1506 RepID=UPI002FCB49B8
MAIENVRKYFKEKGITNEILEFQDSTSTVELAAAALGVEGSRIAKSLSFKEEEGAILVVAAGDTKIDNRKFKEEFGYKAKMLSPDEVIEFTGHGIGGVCPFGMAKDINVYLDESMKRFTTVFPACGSANSAVELTLEELYQYSGAVKWVDVCKLKDS